MTRRGVPKAPILPREGRSPAPRAEEARQAVDREALGAHLADLRSGSGLTQLQVARRVGLAQSKLSHIECGQVEPTLGELYDLAAVYRRTPAAILAEVGPDGDGSRFLRVYLRLRPMDRAAVRQVLQGLDLTGTILAGLARDVVLEEEADEGVKPYSGQNALREHLRRSAMRRLSPDQLRALDVFGRALRHMLEQSILLDPERFRPHFDLLAALEDVQAVVADLEVAAVLPLADPSPSVQNHCSLAGRWATRLYELVGVWHEELEALSSRSFDSDEAVSS